MQLQSWNRWKTNTTSKFWLKCSGVFLLLALSVACSTGASPTADLGNPAVTVTINIGGSNQSPTPSLPDYWCGAWATQTSPVFSTTTVGVYAKFVHNVKSNPGNSEGVGGASAVATVLWPDNTNDTETATTSSDGLATFSIPTANRVSAINRITRVIVLFTSPNGVQCTVTQDRAAFFTLIIVTPTSTAVGSPTPVGTGTPTPIPRKNRGP